MMTQGTVVPRQPVRGLAFVDTETTGLGPEADAWEIALILRDGMGPADRNEAQQDAHILFHVDGFDAEDFDAEARRVSGFDERYGDAHLRNAWRTAEILADSLDGRHLVAANPAFDARILERAMRKYSLAPTWHFRLIDIEALAMGAKQWPTPKGLQATATELGIHFDPADMHTAMGDARLARDIYDHLIWGK